MPKVLLCDNTHVNERNFPDLRRVLFAGFDVIVDERYDADLKDCHGRYEGSCLPALAGEQAERLRSLDAAALRQAEVGGIRLWDTARGEFLSFAIPTPQFQAACDNSPGWDVFGFAWRAFRDELLLNLTAAAWWIDHWRELLALERPDVAVVFSGGCTYAKALLHVCRHVPTEPLVVESSFIGSCHYAERRYTAISNRTHFCHPNVLNSCLRRYDQLKTQATFFRHYENRTNKNVRQPGGKLSAFVRRDFDLSPDRPAILIIAQVPNDYSVVETDCPILNTTRFYKDVIVGLAQRLPDATIVVKTHPWERQKVNVRRDLTYEELLEFLTADANLYRRVRLVSDYHLEALAKVCDAAVTLCSQAGIEVALLGKPVVQAGRAFYGGFGFTEDCRDAAEVVERVAAHFRGDRPFAALAERYDRVLTYAMNFAANHLHLDVKVDHVRLAREMGVRPAAPAAAPGRSYEHLARHPLSDRLRSLRGRLRESKWISPGMFRVIDAVGTGAHRAVRAVRRALADLSSRRRRP